MFIRYFKYKVLASNGLKNDNFKQLGLLKLHFNGLKIPNFKSSACL